MRGLPDSAVVGTARRVARGSKSRKGRKAKSNITRPVTPWDVVGGISLMVIVMGILSLFV